MSFASTLSIDEHGRVLIDESRINDPDQLELFFQSLKFDDNFALTSVYKNEICLVEAFDAPWVLLDLRIEQDRIIGLNTFGFEVPLNFNKCYFDQWDRLNGELENQVPWVLTRSAQESFFDQLDSFDDDGFVWLGKSYTVDPQFKKLNDIDKPSWWSEAYSTGKAGWDLKAPHPALKDMLPRLKLPRSRILVLGCGEGHDAAHLAQEGHVVTAVDFSDVALDRAKELYHSFPIQFLKHDVFELPRSFDKSFDFILEHTLYCAVSPDRRSELVKIWNRSLVQGGYFMGLFFAMEKRFGPPYGAREWEIRQQLQKDYHMLFWGRWKDSPGWRSGKELFMLGQKKS